MTVYGFSKKSTAQAAASLTRQQPPSDNVYPYEPSRGMSWICKGPASGIPGLSGDIPLHAPCKWYLVNNNTGALTVAKNSLGNDLEVEVYNVGANAIAEDEWFVPTLVGDKAVIGVGSGEAGTAPPRIQYEIMRNFGSPPSGQWVAKALMVSTGIAPNPLDPANPIMVGSEFIISDPHNQYPYPTLRDDLIPQAISDQYTGSIGTARLRQPSNSGNMPEDLSQWEIEHQTLPTKRMRVFIKDCLIVKRNYQIPWDPDANPITVYFRSGRPVQLDGYGGCDFPPDVEQSQDGDWSYQLTAYNPLQFTAVKDTYVWIELTTDAIFSVQHQTMPHAFGSQDPKWNIVDVERPYAKWGKFVKGEGLTQWSPTDPREFREGYDGWDNDEGDCELGVDPGPTTCAPTGTEAWGFYSPEDHEYKLISTESAMYGEPTEVEAVTSGTASGCSIALAKTKFQAFCVEGGESDDLDLAQKTVRVATNIVLSNGEICTDYLTIKVCDDPITGGQDCYNLCDALDLVRATVVTGVSWGGSNQQGQICFTYGSVYVCAYDVSPTPACVDICKLICDCPELYSQPEVCDPPPPPCTEDCTYTFFDTRDPVGWYIDGIDDACPPLDPDCQCPDPPEVDPDDPDSWPNEGTRITYRCGEEPPEPENCVCTCLNEGCMCLLLRISYTWTDPAGDQWTAAPKAGEIPPGGMSQYDTCSWAVAMTLTKVDGGETMDDVVYITFQSPDQLTLTSDEGMVAFGEAPPCFDINFASADEKYDGSAGFTLVDADEQDTCGEDPAFLTLDAVKVKRKKAKPVEQQKITAATPHKDRKPKYEGTPIEGAGDQFFNDNQKWFSGCSCKKDVIAVMNRWTRDTMDEEKVMRVAERLKKANKNKPVPINTLRWEIMQAANKWFDKHDKE